MILQEIACSFCCVGPILARLPLILIWHLEFLDTEPRNVYKSKITEGINVGAQRMDQEMPRERLEKVRRRPAGCRGGRETGRVDIRGHRGHGKC